MANTDTELRRKIDAEQRRKVAASLGALKQPAHTARMAAVTRTGNPAADAALQSTAMIAARGAEADVGRAVSGLQDLRASDATAARAAAPPPAQTVEQVRADPNWLGNSVPRFEDAPGAVTPAQATTASQPAPQATDSTPPGGKPMGVTKGVKPGPTGQQRPAPKPPTPRSVIAAASGAPIKPVVAKDTPADPNAQDLYPDDNPFEHDAKVDAMVRSAIEAGDTDMAAQIMGEYEAMVTSKFRVMESQYEREILPEVKRIHAEMVKFQGQQLPRELAIKADQLAMQAFDTQANMYLFGYGLSRNALTKPLAIRLISESGIVAPGQKIADISVNPETGNVEVIAEDGTVVVGPDGAPVSYPLQEVESEFQTRFGVRDNKLQVLKPGEIAVDSMGAVRAENTNADPETSGMKPSEVRMRVQQGTEALKAAMMPSDSLGRLMEDVTPEKRAMFVQLSKKVEALVKQGVDPNDAAATVLEEAGIAPGGAAPTPSAGAGVLQGRPTRPWRRQPAPAGA